MSDNGQAEVTHKYVGQAIKRREDPRLISGQAAFIDDIRLPDMTFAEVVRSSSAHARIKSIDTSVAAGMPGVLGVYTGADFPELAPLPCAWQAAGVTNNINTPHVLAIDEVHQVGDPIAVVVADTLYHARDAVDAVTVDYEELAVVIDAASALADGAAQLHENAPRNIVLQWSCGKSAEVVDAALSASEIRIEQTIRNQRLIPTPIETRGSIGRYEPGTGDYTLWTTSQAPHVMRLLITAFVMAIPENKIRVISPDIGGGFGQKIFLYWDMPLMLALAKRINRPVKYVEDRSSNYLTATHGRDHLTDVQVGASAEGRISALKVNTKANLGAYISTIAPGIPTTLYGRMIAGCYNIPNIHVDVTAFYSNTAMVDAYRGAGRPEAAFVIERVCDLVANATGLDPAEVRRKNFIQPDQFPFDTGVGMLPYDSGNYEIALDRALSQVDYQALRAQQKRQRDSNASRVLGIGLSSYVEVCGVAPSKWIGLPGEGWGAGLWESANVKAHLTGKVVVTTGSLPHGQGHETSFAQLVADELGIPYEDIDIEHSDTLGTPFGYGSYGSRSLSVGGTAIFKTVQKVKDKAKRIAAHMLEAAPEDIVYQDGKCFVQGSPDAVKSFGEIALQASVAYDLPTDMEPFLDETTYYDPPNCTFPFGTHICVVEVDTETGEIELKRYVAVDDVGNVVNPLIVDGQIHGGIAQGLAQALYEGAEYSIDGELVTGTLNDYAIPRAGTVPVYELDRTVTPSPVNPMGVKGAGEAGTIAATPAVANAVIDALSHLGVQHLDMPLIPEKLWDVLYQTRTRAA